MVQHTLPRMRAMQLLGSFLGTYMSGTCEPLTWPIIRHVTSRSTG